MICYHWSIIPFNPASLRNPLVFHRLAKSICRCVTFAPVQFMFAGRGSTQFFRPNLIHLAMLGG